MPILVMGLIALAVFGVIGLLLFLAESSERRQHTASHETAETPKRAVPVGKHAG